MTSGREDGKGGGEATQGTDTLLVARERKRRESESDLYRHVTRVTRKIKKTFAFAHSVSTGDMVNVLARRWAKSGEWQKLAERAGPERKIGTSVKRVLIDELRRQRHEEEKQKKLPSILSDVVLDAVEAMSEDQILDRLELACMYEWCNRQIEALVNGRWDERVRALPVPPDIKLVGTVLYEAMRGLDPRKTAKKHGLEEAHIDRLLSDGQSYLAFLRHLEETI